MSFGKYSYAVGQKVAALQPDALKTRPGGTGGALWLHRFTLVSMLFMGDRENSLIHCKKAVSETPASSVLSHHNRQRYFFPFHTMVLCTALSLSAPRRPGRKESHFSAGRAMAVPAAGRHPRAATTALPPRARRSRCPLPIAGRGGGGRRPLFCAQTGCVAASFLLLAAVQGAVRKPSEGKGTG